MPVKGISTPSSVIKKVLLFLVLGYAIVDFFPINYSLGLYYFCFLVLICASYCLIFPKQPIVDGSNKLPLMFFVFWLSYALLSYLWAVDRSEALTYCIIILRAGLIFLMFGAMFRDSTIRESAHWFVILVMLGYLGIAIWELLSRQHLPISRLYGSIVPSPTGPFYGENVLAAFLLLFTPYIFLLSKLSKSIIIKYASGLWVLAILAIMIIQGARIALISATLLTLYILAFHSSKSTKVLSLVFLVILVLGLSYYAPAVYDMTVKGLQKEIKSIGFETESVRMSSVKIRKQLFVEGGDIISQSHFMGVGGGNFERYINTDRIYRTGGITNPHNFFLELAGNFGLGMLILFMIVYARWLYMLRRAARFADPSKRDYYRMNFLSLLMFIPSSSLPSSIRWQFLIWIYFAYINAVATSGLKNIVSHHSPTESQSPIPINGVYEESYERI